MNDGFYGQVEKHAKIGDVLRGGISRRCQVAFRSPDPARCGTHARAATVGRHLVFLDLMIVAPFLSIKRPIYVGERAVFQGNRFDTV